MGSSENTAEGVAHGILQSLRPPALVWSAAGEQDSSQQQERICFPFRQNRGQSAPGATDLPSCPPTAIGYRPTAVGRSSGAVPNQSSLTWFLEDCPVCDPCPRGCNSGAPLPSWTWRHQNSTVKSQAEGSAGFSQTLRSYKRTPMYKEAWNGIHPDPIPLEDGSAMRHRK